jgi:Zn-dependent peptidase ImmA (M78 family)/transcriptional regulator with XRE-family HTH domain
MPLVNPEILRWARVTAGLTLEEASQRLSISEARGISPVSRLSALERGETEPSRPILLKMAKQYRRPLIVFYMENPPRKADRGQDFRILPDSISDVTSGMVDALIRDVKVRQSIIKAAIEDEDDFEPIKFVGCMRISDGVEAVVRTIIKISSIDITKFRSQPSSEDAFKYLRNQVENTGVFVLLIGDLGSHHTAFDIEVFRGFALSDAIAPFIIINDKDSKAAWSFTLLHELAHILLGHTGISNTNSELEIEQFCNRVASDILLPEVDLRNIHFTDLSDFEDRKTIISDYAHTLNLSSSMVAYKLYLLGKIDRPIWVQLNREYRKLWLETRQEKRELRRGKEGGPSYYVLRRHRLGEHLITLVHQMVLGGTLTTMKASKVLGVTPKNIQSLIEPAFGMKSR